MQKKRIWITWENQRRNRELSLALGAELYELKYIDAIKNPLKKYLVGMWKTLLILIRERPDIVFCQNPSLILASMMVTIKHIFGIKVCVDAHNAGLFPEEGRSSLLGLLSKYIQRKADITIVTNTGMSQYVEINNGRPFILPDKIPAIPMNQSLQLKGKYNFLYICTYALDEPYEQVILAAKNLDPQIFIYITGNFKKRNIDPKSLPENVILTGYIPEEDYIALLHSVDATIDLTTRDDCLVCGAYETVAVEKPMILSDTTALRQYFNKGTEYTTNTASGISEAITNVIKRKNALDSDVKDLKNTLQIEWELKKEKLESVINAW